MIICKTVMREGSAEQIIERSRFIGYAKPVASREEAEGFLAEIRAKHKDATHNVPAFVIGDQFQLQWASDDGEPQGTSGAPMVQMLVKEGISNIVIVITRYFGGVKLGPGGLVRAYTSTAKLALAAAGICFIKEMCVLRLKLDYTYHGKLVNLSQEGEFYIRQTTFEDFVTVELVTDLEKEAEIKTMISNLTGGTGQILSAAKEKMNVQE